MPKTTILIVLLLFFSHTILSQITFEKGYFIDIDGRKTYCLIQNERWLFSPQEVFYKMDEDSEVKSFSVENCQEFRIGEEGVFKRVASDFPITQSKLKKKEKSPEPEMVKLTVFVQMIIDGTASLYWYVDNNGIVYLYSKDNGPIQPLIYKKYVLTSLKIRENMAYKQQLIRDFPCGNVPLIQEIKYQRKSLVNYFKLLNTCSGNDDFVQYRRGAVQKANFPITLKAWFGAERNTYEARNNTRNFDFGNETNVKFGGELEAFFPYFGYKKTALFLSGQVTQATNEFNFPEGQIGSNSFTTDYSIVEVQLGGRFYFDISKKASFFVEAALAADFFGDSSITEVRTIFSAVDGERVETLQVGEAFGQVTGGSFGVGFSYDKRLYLKFSARTNQVVLEESIRFSGDKLGRLGASLGYAFW